MSRNLDLVHHVARAWSGVPEEADELTQVAFIKAWRSFGAFRAGTNFKAWILRILRNTFIDQERAKNRKPATVSLDRLESDREPAETIPPPRAIDLSTREIFYDVFGDEVARLLKALPTEHQIPVILCDVEGLSYQEIAEVLGVPLGTVRSRIHRGRARLSELMRDYADKVGYLRDREP